MSDINSMAAGEYVLGTLAPLERREFERRLAADPLLRLQVAKWERDLAPLLNSAEPLEPSPALWDRIESSLDQMESGGNVVPFRRPLMRRRIPLALAGTLAASLAGFVFLRMSVGTGPAPAQPTAQATAPALPSQTGPQPAAKVMTATPCPTESSRAVQTASGAREPSTRQEPVSNSVASAGAARDQGGVAVNKPEGTGNVSIASAAKPEGSGNVSIASAPRPEGAGNVSIASAAKPEGSGNVSIASAPRPEGANNFASELATTPQGNGNVANASAANSDCK
jgi:hypothetical protein